MYKNYEVWNQIKQKQRQTTTANNDDDDDDEICIITATSRYEFISKHFY